ncbi:hypothetical protein [Evansella cellulosilytica]|uniref:5'-3' exonuclease domain containing protein n=1 Tax=Evansella cellulosilytica (strain ATCC 21833 / DSM 2522 / FERM P-1141 / JCM 9156 / N-4) TaxID=649639 RepID=E6TX41_EVAC2|nr:hypothetical protein [Evansella cellulosilytica]ADU31130.1 5'-3' exonuclease domain containing protein [Evansella cellulosilytica DSM 2522]
MLYFLSFILSIVLIIAILATWINTKKILEDLKMIKRELGIKDTERKSSLKNTFIEDSEN